MESESNYLSVRSKLRNTVGAFIISTTSVKNLTSRTIKYFLGLNFRLIKLVRSPSGAGEHKGTFSSAGKMN